jgi:uncharacterized membrane protein
MVIWGAFWGAVLGLLWRGYGWESHVVGGAILGALAGLSLRRVVRKEIAAAQAAIPAKVIPAAAAARPALRKPEETPTARDFEDTQPTPAVPQRAAAQTATPATATEPIPQPAKPPVRARPDPVTLLIGKARDWLFGGNTVVRMGVLVLFVGLAFLAKYAVDNALLPPQLRLAAIAAAGIGLFVAGFRLRHKGEEKRGYALTLQGAGVAVLYLTVFAAFRLYQFLPAGAAFAALALVCLFSAVIALAQNALPMAFIGFAGGFAAPVLVSTGQGSHVALFSYYLLLSVAIAAIAWLKAWRALNLLGFFATFGVATVWGVLRYEPRHLATTEPFLIGFFLVYLAASLLYALRHAHPARKAVDATLVFGTPIVAFGLQAALVRNIEYATAFSSLALGALYLALGWWLVRRAQAGHEVSRWLAECFAALGLGFVTLAVPLALDGRWTAAVWAVEGAGVYWMGRRQGRWLARAAGLALQAFAALAFLESLNFASQGNWPFANPAFVGATMLAGAALAIAWWSRERLDATGSSQLAANFMQVEVALSPVLLWAGFLWWQFALHGEIDRWVLDVNRMVQPIFSPAAQVMLTMLGWVGSAFALHLLALPARAKPWPVAGTPAWTTMPVMLLTALWGMATLDHVFQSGGWIAWPLALALHLTMLRRLDAGRPQRWWPWVHAGGVWLVVLLGGNLLVFAIGKAQLWQTAWATVILLVAGSVVLLVLTRRSWFAGGGTRWPLDRFAHAYLWRAAAPLAVALAAGALLVAVHSNGDARPLPYVPLLNPTDLAVALALTVCTRWLLQLRSGTLAVPPAARGPAPIAVLAGIAFIALNTVWLRVAHHYAAVPWDADRMFTSFLVQAGYSILWTLLALGLMVGAHRRAWRTGWMLGAGLLAVTVLKLFVIDLSNRGGTERIFVFIAVGLLMLVVGYFAPLPPAQRDKEAGALQGAST